MEPASTVESEMQTGEVVEGEAAAPEETAESQEPQAEDSASEK